MPLKDIIVSFVSFVSRIVVKQEKTMSFNTISNERGIKTQKLFMIRVLGLNSLHMVFIIKKLNPLFQVTLIRVGHLSAFSGNLIVT